MPYQLDPTNPQGISKKPKDGFVPYFAGGPGKPSLVDKVNGKTGDVQLNLDDLTDVELGTPADNQALAYDSATSKFIPQSIASLAGGDVTGPASSTDNAVARYDGTTGKVVQDSGAVLDDTGNLLHPGYLRVGSVSAPSNTTAGDVTGTRLTVGDDTAFSSATGSFAKFKGELTDTGGGAKYGVYSQADMNNATASTSEVRVLGMSAQVKSGNSQNIGTLIGIFGETRVFGNSTTSTLIGGRFFGGVFPSTTELSGKTISSVNALDVTGFKISGTPPNTATITTAKGININNNDAPSPITMTSSIGLDIAAQTRGATNNFGIRIAAPSGATNNYALQLSDTGGTSAGGITFGTDTNLYRSAASTLRTDDDFTVIGKITVAPTTNPQLMIDVGGTNTASGARGIKVSPTLTGGASAGIEAQPTLAPTSNTGAAYGLINIANGSPPTGVTITTLYGGFYRVDTGSTAGAVTNVNTMAAAAPSFGTLKPTNIIGVNVQNQGSASVASAIGVDVNAQTAATTTIGMRIALPTGSTAYALQLADTTGVVAGGITFGTDVTLYRSAANVLKSDDKVLAALGIGVGNSAAATTLGAVTKKMEVFDASGASLGFVPIYDTIT